jgi:hypothetical protein
MSNMSNISLTLSQDEIVTLLNAINNSFEFIDSEEYQTLMGATQEQARQLWTKLKGSLENAERTSTNVSTGDPAQ